MYYRNCSVNRKKKREGKEGRKEFEMWLKIYQETSGPKDCTSKFE